MSVKDLLASFKMLHECTMDLRRKSVKHSWQKNNKKKKFSKQTSCRLFRYFTTKHKHNWPLQLLGQDYDLASNAIYVGVTMPDETRGLMLTSSDSF